MKIRSLGDILFSILQQPQKGVSMNCENQIKKNPDMPRGQSGGITGGMAGQCSTPDWASQGNGCREQTVGEHFDYQINRALESIEQLRAKKKFAEDRGFAAMSISAYERQFGLYVSGPF